MCGRWKLNSPMQYGSPQVREVVGLYSVGTREAQQALLLRLHPFREQDASLSADRRLQPHEVPPASTEEGSWEKTNPSVPLKHPFFLFILTDGRTMKQSGI